MTLIISFLSNWGGVGDCLFFIISAWFLCDEEQSYERNISRCWHLEKQLWFWSLSLFIGCLIVWHMRGETPGVKTLASPWPENAVSIRCQLMVVSNILYIVFGGMPLADTRIAITDPRAACSIVCRLAADIRIDSGECIST